MSAKTICLFLVVVVLVVSQVSSKPASDGNLSQCYGRECPPSTYACKKEVRSNSDMRFLHTKIYCLARFGNTLKEYFEESPNPTPGRYHYDYDYSGPYSYSYNYNY